LYNELILINSKSDKSIALKKRREYLRKIKDSSKRRF